ncbi:hypothetical protein ACFSTD_12790 [Novosphingobium colocasiae]|nr:hypothetical protein [Novosphingobium colocasiae]
MTEHLKFSNFDAGTLDEMELFRRLTGFVLPAETSGPQRSYLDFLWRP